MKTLNLKIGDKIRMVEILSGAGISTQGYGKVEKILKEDNGNNTYLARAKDGKLRLLSHQGKWGYAYNYLETY